MASQSQDFPKAISEGNINVINDYPLIYVILEDDQILINERSFYDYLGLNTKDKKISTLPSPTDDTVAYQPLSGNDIEIGLPILDIAAFCINIIELHAETKKYKDVSRNAVVLLMYLATHGLNEFIDDDILKEPKPSYRSLLAGVLKVPPPQK
jgi:hypothetical protein